MIRELQMKTTVRYHLTPIRMAIIRKSTNNKHWRGWEEKETLLHCGWKCKWVQPLWRTVWRSHKKLKTELPCDPAVSLLGIYLNKTINQKTYADTSGCPRFHCRGQGLIPHATQPKHTHTHTHTHTDICTLEVTEALFTIAKTWKQSKWPLTDKWLKKMWYIYAMEYYLTIKKEWNTICSNMDGPRNYHNKWSKPEKDKYHMILLGS